MLSSVKVRYYYRKLRCSSINQSNKKVFIFKAGIYQQDINKEKMRYIDEERELIKVKSGALSRVMLSC